jgi:hypothetical protein
VLVRLKEQQQLDDAWVIDAAHDLNLFENVGALLWSVCPFCGEERQWRVGRGRRYRVTSAFHIGSGDARSVQPREPTKACNKILSSLEGQRLQVGVWKCGAVPREAEPHVEA